MKLFLLRHAHSTGNEQNILDSWMQSSLSEKGKEQAKKLVPLLQEYSFDIIIHSSLIRTGQTLEPYLKATSTANPLIDPLVIERNNGDFTGKPMDSFKKFCKEKNLDVVTTVPKNGESVADVHLRAEKFLQKIKQEFPHKKVLVCSHSSFLRCLETVILQRPLKNIYSYPLLENTELKIYDL